MVTSTSSGLSVPDWPTTYGHNMFAFLTIGLALFIWRVDPRRWMKRLGVIALAVVIVQGVLGGLTVLYFLPAPISIGHAGLAQIFFCLTVAIALFTSKRWRRPAVAPVDDPALRRGTMHLAAAIYIQILLGATMRHLGAGLAIPTFPLVYGGLLPPAWPLPIAIHYAHRVGALVVIIAAALLVRRILASHGQRQELTRPLLVLVLAISVQVTLGGLVVLSLKDPIINTLHVATGASVLAASLVLALRAHRVRFGH
jgi:cytochrome c oxidase assembly protein subunit 15